MDTKRQTTDPTSAPMPTEYEPPRTSAAAAVPTPAPESLDQVRDILFGSQMRSVEARLQAMEERLMHEQRTMRADLERKLAAIDSHAREELRVLGERLNAERASRTDALTSMHEELMMAIRDLEKRHARLQEASMADAEIRDQLLLHAAATSSEFTRTTETLSADLERSHTELMSRKTDRAALAQLLSDIASRLDGSAPTSDATD